MLFLSDFVLRQTPESRFSHWSISNEELLKRVAANWNKRHPSLEHRGEGVTLVPVSPEGFFTSVVILKEGDKFRGGFEARTPGEDPRKWTALDRGYPRPDKPPAVSVEIVLYRKDVLDEDGDWLVQYSPTAGDDIEENWAVVSVNASPTAEPVVMEMGALLANHFHLSGGTSDGLTPEQFEKALERSLRYWKDKSHLG